jgi:hypothetical protein
MMDVAINRCIVSALVGPVRAINRFHVRQRLSDAAVQSAVLLLSRPLSTVSSNHAEVWPSSAPAGRWKGAVMGEEWQQHIWHWLRSRSRVGFVDLTK